MSQAMSQTAGRDIEQAESGGLWPATWALWHREMVRFFRERHRVASVFITPVLLWLGLGAGLDRAFAPSGGGALELLAHGTAGDLGAAQPTGYLAYFFPGTLSMIVLFTAVFSAISVIEDRREGFMQGVLVAPIPRLSIVLGKVLGGAGIAMIQGCVFLLLWPMVGAFPGVGSALAAVGVLLVLAVAMTAMGLCIAWPMDSTAGFHAIMMLVLMPMWFLSGALFPVSTAMPWLRYLMWANPLTYGQSVLTQVLLGRDMLGTGLPMWLDVLLMLFITAGVLALAVRLVGRPRRDGV